MPLVRDDDVVRIDLPEPGEWVEVKRRMGKGDMARAQDASARGSRISMNGGGATDGLIIGEGAVDRATFALLEIAIRRWSFEEPVTPETIRQLDEDSYDAIIEQMNVLYARRGADERKNSNGAGTTPSSAEATSPQSSSA
jgi:hypothetical protein